VRILASLFDYWRVRSVARFFIIFARGKGSAALVPIPSSSAESGRSRRELYFAVAWSATDSFARPVFVFLTVGEFQEQSDSELARLRHPLGAFSQPAKQIVRSILPQPVPRPLAFLQA
jgi:hypothetical protein